MTAYYLPAICIWSVAAVIWLAVMPIGRARWLDYAYPVVPIVAAAAYLLLPGPAIEAVPWSAWYDGGIRFWIIVTAVWIVSVVMRDASIMDIAYGAAVVFVAWIQWLSSGADTSAHTLLVLGAVAVWGIRNTVYVAWRNLPRGEDARYERWRARFGARWWWWSYFQIFLVQAVIIWIWYAPIGFALSAPGPLSVMDIVAAGVWAIGFAFEAGGDAQLARFKSDPENRGKVLDTGLWSMTRHPNYFGEATMWCGYFLLALRHPWGWLAAASAAYTVWFMYKGSATSLLERHMLKTRPLYADYVARVPSFVPRLWPGTGWNGVAKH